MQFNQKWMAARFDPTESGKYDFFPAEVPGNVQYDYAKANGFGDFVFADNVKIFKETEDFYWIYRTELDYKAKDSDRIFFVSKGIDYVCDIRLDGKIICSHEGMFSDIECDITDSVHVGSILEVIVYPHPKREEAPYGREQASQSCKPPFCYGWDWNPRVLVSGIWQDTYIETRGYGYIDYCEPFYKLSEDRNTAYLTFKSKSEAEIIYTLSNMDGKIIYSGTNSEVTIENVNLWWCNGQGIPYLYRWSAETEGHKREGKIGFKTVRLVRNAEDNKEQGMFPKTRYGAPITVELNGRKIFAYGSNWVNADLFPGRVTQSQLRELLGAAFDAGMNILRVWGGSGINKDAFYDICDELGIMLWQEFMLSCNNYIGTEKYLKVLKQEATTIVRKLRSHASISIWCGGNELFNNWSGMDDQSHALRLLNKICYEEDFEKPYLSTSPLYGMAHGGYFFKSPETGDEVFEIMRNSARTAYTEFGVPSVAPVSQLRKIIPENELFPLEPTAAWTEHHGFNAWMEDSWIYLPTLKEYFGEFSTIDEVVAASDWLQGIGYKAIFEEARRQWPHCSMAINWCFNEPWITAANNSIISYPTVKKPAYYAVKDALRTVMSSARIEKFSWKAGELFSPELWMLNNSADVVSDAVTAYLQIGDKKYELLTWKTGELAAFENKQGPKLNFILPNLPDAVEMTLKLVAGKGRESNYRLKYTAFEEMVTQNLLNI